MGTAKYPAENEYGQFLTEHGGWSNAFTADEHTNYFFEVDSDHLEQALDRFAQFFISPTFGYSGEGAIGKDGTSREMNAVNSEHLKNIKNDYWRIHQLDRDLSNPKHPYSKFGTGTFETLNQPEILEILKKFYSGHYSANIMALVVYGKESLDVLEDMVQSKFNNVPNHSYQVPEWANNPWLPGQFHSQIIMKTEKEMRSINVVFPVPEDTQKFYPTKPFNYFAHLIGHEGKNGLLTYLKKKNWALDLGTGLDESFKGFSFYSVVIELTPIGLENIDSILKALFSFINLMSKMGPQEWVYDECKRIAELEFRFKDKSQSSSIAYKLAGWMHEYPAEHFLNGHLLMDKYDPDLLTRTLKYLNPDNFRTLLSLSAVDDEHFEKAKWYGTKFKVEKISPELIKELKKVEVLPELKYPGPNDFIPQDLTIIGTLEPESKLPTQLRSNLVYKIDDTFGLPKAIVFILIRMDIYQSPRDHVSIGLFTELFQDSLTELVYDADLAGLKVELKLIPEGLEIKFSGFNDKLKLLMERVSGEADRV